MKETSRSKSLGHHILLPLKPNLWCCSNNRHSKLVLSLLALGSSRRDCSFLLTGLVTEGMIISQAASSMPKNCASKRSQLNGANILLKRSTKPLKHLFIKHMNWKPLYDSVTKCWDVQINYPDSTDKEEPQKVSYSCFNAEGFSHWCLAFERLEVFYVLVLFKWCQSNGQTVLMMVNECPDIHRFNTEKFALREHLQLRNNFWLSSIKNQETRQAVLGRRLTSIKNTVNVKVKE